MPGFDSSSLSVLSLLLDRDNGLWVGTTGKGIYHLRNNQVDRFDTGKGLSSDVINSFFQDHEGGVWAITARGVDSFHKQQIRTFSSREGLSVDNVVSVVVSKDDTVWLANGPSLTSIKAGRVTGTLRANNGLPGNEVTALFADSSGELWVGVDADLYLYRGRHFLRVHRKDGSSTRLIVGMTEDSSHDIWAEVSGAKRELVRIHALEIVEEYPESSIPSARSLAADERGNVWLGLRNGDLAQFHDGHTRIFPFPHSSDGQVRQVIVNPDQSVFGASASGLVAVRNGLVRTLTTRNGLPCDGIVGVIWDNMGALWLDTQCGLVRLQSSDIARWWADPDAVLQPRLFDADDGVQPGIPDFNPMAKSSDGVLWFANQSVLQTVDPGHLVRNEIPPPVQVERVIADRKGYSPINGLQLPPLMRDLEIDYAGLSFSDPRKVKFHYQLEGRDSDWQDAGIRRQAFYNDLHPGNYRFHVIASNNDGVRNDAGAILDFSIAPAWYQTAPFRSLCVLIFALTVWLLYKLRTRQISRSRPYVRFEERLAERTHLARELHDTFLQTLQGSKLVAEAALDKSSDSEYVRRSLEKLSSWLDQAMREGRAALNSLRTPTLQAKDVGKSFKEIVDASALHGFTQRILDVNGDVIELHPIIAHEIYRIGYEAIHNAIQHSGGSRLEVTLTYSRDILLQVRDNGAGMKPTLVAEGRAGHFGLQSMRERAARIGARFKLSSSLGDGTTIELRISANSASRGRQQLDAF